MSKDRLVKKQTPKLKLSKILDIAGELAPILAVLSRSRWTAGLSIGIKLADIGAQLYEEFGIPRGNVWGYFQDKNREWVFVPKAFHSYILERAQMAKVVARGHSDDDPVAVEAFVGGIHVGWVGKAAEKGAQSITSMWVRKEDEERVRDEFRDELWTTYGTKHLVLGAFSFEKESEHKFSGRFIQTNLIESVTQRVEAFLKDGVRSYLIEGRPGTGKTTCIQHVVKKLGLRSLRIPLSEVCAALDPQTSQSEKDHLSIRFIISVLQPSVVAFNDLDRAPPHIQDQLLDLLEDIREHTTAILVSANYVDELDSAVKRPERLDDHITVPPLGKELVAAILGKDCSEHAERMANWPIGFINDYLRRMRVLGKEQADREIVELEKRVKEQAEEKREPRFGKVAQLRVSQPPSY